MKSPTLGSVCAVVIGGGQGIGIGTIGRVDGANDGSVGGKVVGTDPRAGFLGGGGG